MVLLYLVGCFLWSGEEEVEQGAPAEDPSNPLPTLELGKTTSQPRAPLIRPGHNSGPEAPVPAITEEMCDDLDDGGKPAGPGCITAEIACGDTVIGHTLGGTQNFDTRFYEAFFCTPALTDHSGGDERVYRLRMPEGKWTATVWMDSPCADLDMAAMEVDNDETCPTINSHVPRCEMWPKPQGDQEKVRLVSQRESTWLIVVEGVDQEEGAFALHVDCNEGL
jgi:hypothetical protein